MVHVLNETTWRISYYIYEHSYNTDRLAWQRFCPRRGSRSSRVRPACRRSQSVRPPPRSPTSDPVSYVTAPPGTGFSRTPPPFRECATADEDERR